MTPQDLQGIAVLRDLDPAAVARLATILEPRSYADGEPIFAEGAPGDGMYFILSGAVRIQKQTGTGTQAQKTLTILEPGDYFGEMALLDQQPRSASAVASGDTRTLRLSSASFGELHGGTGRAGLGVLFAMIRTASERIRRLSAQVVVYDEVGKAIGESKTLDELLGVVLTQLAQATLADWGLVVLRAQFSDRLEVRRILNLDLTQPQREDLGSGKGFLAPALEDSEGCLISDLESAERFRRCPRLGFESFPLLLVPIAVGAQRLGLIALGGHQAGQFDLGDLNLARGVARQAAQAILNARHREEDEARIRHSKRLVRF